MYHVSIVLMYRTGPDGDPDANAEKAISAAEHAMNRHVPRSRDGGLLRDMVDDHTVTKIYGVKPGKTKSEVGRDLTGRLRTLGFRDVHVVVQSVKFDWWYEHSRQMVAFFGAMSVMGVAIGLLSWITRP